MDYSNLSKTDIVNLLKSEGKEKEQLFESATTIKEEYVGNYVYLRGLLEYSNICSKNCYYCGVRCANNKIERYTLKEKEIEDCLKEMYEKGIYSLVLQSGERTDKKFISEINNTIKKAMQITNGNLRITLSVGEQNPETFRMWYESGANRYLLRIEDHNPELYKKIHPDDDKHSYKKRLKAIEDLKNEGYQVGTGIMTGLPFQTLEDIADDILFFKEYDIDMFGLGPYIEHEETPLYKYKDQLLPKEERFELALKVIAILRVYMKDVNIAATTAMQALDNNGREKAVKIGANVIMPNFTPLNYRDSYLLYEDKPGLTETSNESLKKLEETVTKTGNKIVYNEFGDSRHYHMRNS